MKALLVIDVQNGIVQSGDFKEEIILMENIIKDFKNNLLPVIFMRHIDEDEISPLYRGSVGSELHDSLKNYADYVLEKQTPSSFYKTDLTQTLESLAIEKLFIIGFNTEFCCMFTAIAAFDRGYKVTFIENATGTENNEETYEMPGLNIKKFVGTVLKWSDAIEVLNYDEYVEEYRKEDAI